MNTLRLNAPCSGSDDDYIIFRKHREAEHFSTQLYCKITSAELEASRKYLVKLIDTPCRCNDGRITNALSLSWSVHTGAATLRPRPVTSS